MTMDYLKFIPNFSCECSSCKNMSVSAALHQNLQVIEWMGRFSGLFSHVLGMAIPEYRSRISGLANSHHIKGFLTPGNQRGT